MAFPAVQALALAVVLALCVADDYDSPFFNTDDYYDASLASMPEPMNASYVTPPAPRGLAAVVIAVDNPNLFYMGRWKEGTTGGTRIFDWGGFTIRMRITGTTSLGVSLQVTHCRAKFDGHLFWLLASARCLRPKRHCLAPGCHLKEVPWLMCP